MRRPLRAEAWQTLCAWGKDVLGGQDPYIVIADWSATPRELEESGWLRSLFGAHA